MVIGYLFNTKTVFGQFIFYSTNYKDTTFFSTSLEKSRLLSFNPCGGCAFGLRPLCVKRL